MRKCAPKLALSREERTLTRNSINFAMSSTSKRRRKKRQSARNVPAKQLLRKLWTRFRC